MMILGIGNIIINVGNSCAQNSSPKIFSKLQHSFDKLFKSLYCLLYAYMLNKKINFVQKHSKNLTDPKFFMGIINSFLKVKTEI